MLEAVAFVYTVMKEYLFHVNYTLYSLGKSLAVICRKVYNSRKYTCSKVCSLGEWDFRYRLYKEKVRMNLNCKRCTHTIRQWRSIHIINHLFPYVITLSSELLRGTNTLLKEVHVTLSKF